MIAAMCTWFWFMSELMIDKLTLSHKLENDLLIDYGPVGFILLHASQVFGEFRGYIYLTFVNGLCGIMQNQTCIQNSEVAIEIILQRLQCLNWR